MRLGVFVVVVVVLAKLRAAHQLERRLARTDPLTGVANFRWFEEEAQREMYSSRRYGGPLSPAYLDLDDFKRINDERGHAAGDEALRAVADALRTHLRPTDPWPGSAATSSSCCCPTPIVAARCNNRAWSRAPGPRGAAR